MQTLGSHPLTAKWKDSLDLSNREIPELHENPEFVGHGLHANAIRSALEDLGASAVFCVQSVPATVLVELDEYDRETVHALHGELWNQGLATLLLVISGNTVRTFSLARIPCSDVREFHDRCLVQQLDAFADARVIKNLIHGVESGRLWQCHAKHFKANETVGQVLLDNLSASHSSLCKDGLSSDAAQALLMQTMFIACLEDRNIVGPEYFRAASEENADTLLELLKEPSAVGLYRLFEALRRDFNDDLFIAPCSFETDAPKDTLLPEHLQTLARFRDGREVLGEVGGQSRFLGYNFKRIPIELMSAVCDRFLGASKEKQRLKGAYYTPAHLADSAISALWDTVTDSIRAKGVFLDPACGSGVFLVRAFQLLCEHLRRTQGFRTILWNDLHKIMARLNGCDIDASAIRVAAFSLHVVLLQEVRAPDIRALIEQGRFLPKLRGHTLRECDFFQRSSEDLRADVIIGNPPWSNRHGTDRRSVIWCAEHQYPMPGREDAWAFVWKSLRHLNEHGKIAFLLPAMGFLHNHSKSAVDARMKLVNDTRIFRVVNFSDLRFQMFEGAARPAALIVLGHGESGAPGYRFDYWAPKADSSLQVRRVITLTSADRGSMTTRDVEEDPLVFKRRLWMTDPEAKLFRYLGTFPNLGDRVAEYRTAFRNMDAYKNLWVVGSGFQPVQGDRLHDPAYRSQPSDAISNTAFLPIGAFRVLGQDNEHCRVFNDGHDGIVRRRGFERGFEGPRVLIPRGISVSRQRLRASYIADPLTFQDNILSVSVPDHDAYEAKLLTALLNSKLLFWFAFHGTATFGSDRPEIHQSELLRLPFPSLAALSHNDLASDASDALVSIIDEALESAESVFSQEGGLDALFDRLDAHCYRYFGLVDEEIILVEDAVAKVIPSVQPHAGKMVELWKPAGPIERETYAKTLCNSLSEWFTKGTSIRVELEARNDDLALLHLRLVGQQERQAYREKGGEAVGSALARLSANLGQSLPGNFQLLPDFHLFVGKSLYFVKPLQHRYWLRSAAIADADAIAVELHVASQRRFVGSIA